MSHKVGAFAWYSVKIRVRVIFGVRFERRKVDIKKAHLDENWNMRILFLSLLNFKPNVIKSDPYNFERYSIKVGTFFETQCITSPAICKWNMDRHQDSTRSSATAQRQRVSYARRSRLARWSCTSLNTASTVQLYNQVAKQTRGEKLSNFRPKESKIKIAIFWKQ